MDPITRLLMEAEMEHHARRMPPGMGPPGMMGPPGPPPFMSGPPMMGPPMMRLPGMMGPPPVMGPPMMGPPPMLGPPGGFSCMGPEELGAMGHPFDDPGFMGDLMRAEGIKHAIRGRGGGRRRELLRDDEFEDAMGGMPGMQEVMGPRGGRGMGRPEMMGPMGPELGGRGMEAMGMGGQGMRDMGGGMPGGPGGMPGGMGPGMGGGMGGMMGGVRGDMRGDMGGMGSRGGMMDHRMGGASGGLVDEEELDLLMAQMATGGMDGGGRCGRRRPRF
ncbi:hypothetical protein WHR41_08568 [Cladosporium halotolerans]|uniref:Uncharacterized protein n=1 Tax=Cladosporium halotolerans TaxID=1052096 RepID=A0AB34KCN1_9PEZI